MSDVLLQCSGVVKTFGGFTALDQVSVDVKKGERFGLIGPNGSGKTTLINCISGALKNDGGTITFDGTDMAGMAPHQRTRLGICRSFQIPRPFTSMTVLENLAIPFEYVALRGHRHASPDAEAKAVREGAMAILTEMGMADKASAPSSGLTQIELRKLELARAMAAKPKLLISDEAMAGLSNSEVDEILDILFRLNEQHGITIVMIEHIMRAVMRFSQRVVCLDAGKKIAEATPDLIVKDPNVERAYLGE
ncbi:MAG: ABC transporter ATP-binding protein [Alphaproteobacteria bacterium]|nr:ABC transporter ATP-binding protein [Alphaproteobacteria bacterium]